MLQINNGIMTGNKHCSTSKKVIILGNTLIQSSTNDPNFSRSETSLDTKNEEEIIVKKRSSDQVYPAKTKNKLDPTVQFVRAEIYPNDTPMRQELVYQTKNLSISISENEKVSVFMQLSF